MVEQIEKKEYKKLIRKFSESADDGNCVLCCEKVKIFAVGHCDHPICFKCSSRMRVLATEFYCAACRAEMDEVIFITEVQPFKKIKVSDCIKTIRKYGIRFKSRNILYEFNDLLAYYCSECSKDEGPFYSKRELTTHVRKEHEKQFCNICVDNLKLFPQEFKIYSKKELVRHRREGDVDEKSHRGHPECRFCDDRFFDNDALLVHLRKNHFWCHFCEHDGKQDYFNIYRDLRRHFMAEHYLCDEGNCVNEKYTSVFRDKIDFQAHKLAYHGKNLSKIQAKEARKVDLDYSFTRRQQKSNVVSGNDYEEVQREENRSRHHNRYKNSRDRYGTVNYYDYDDVEKDRKVFQAKKKNNENRDAPLEGTVDMATARNPSSEEENDDDVIGLPEHVNKGERVKHEKRQVEIVNTKAEEETVKRTQPRNTDNIPDKGIDQTDFPTLPASKANTAQESATDPFPTLAASNPSKKPTNIKEDSKNPLGTVLNGIPVKHSRKGKGKSWSKQSGRDINNVDDFPALGVANKQVKEQEKLSKSPNLVQKETHKEQMLAKQNHNKQLDRNPKSTSPSVRKKEDNTMSQKPPPGFSKSDQQTTAVTKKSPPGLSENDRPTEAPPGLKKSGANTADGKMERNIRLLALLQAVLDDFTFGIFKNLSGEFRKDIKSAQEYYSGISELLGENLKVVFSELVALLPDPKKQEELLMIHNNEKIRLKENKETNTQADYSRKAIWTGGELVCNKVNVKKEITESYCACGAVFPKDLIQEHMGSHAGEAFPALPTAVTKKKTYNFIPARTNPQIPIKSAWKVK